MDFVDKKTNEYYPKDSSYFSNDSKRITFLEKEGYLKAEEAVEKDA